MTISELNHSKIITISLEDQARSGETSGRRGNALDYLEKVSSSKSRITIEGYSGIGIKHDDWCSPQRLGGDSLTREISGRLNGSSRQYHLGDTVTDFDKRVVGKKTRRESAVRLSIQKFLDAHKEGIDLLDPYNGLLNISIAPNTMKERMEQLFYMDQLLAFLKRFPSLEQVSKERRKKIIEDSNLNVWIGARGGVDDISRPHFSQNSSKFIHTSVLF